MMPRLHALVRVLAAGVLGSTLAPAQSISRLVPERPIAYLRVGRPADLDRLGAPLGMPWIPHGFLLVSWLGLPGLEGLEGLDTERPWHFFVTVEDEARSKRSALVGLEDRSAFERSLLGLPVKPGFEIQEDHLLLGALPLPKARGELPRRELDAPIELHLEPSRLLDVAREGLEEQAVVQQSLAERWEALLSGRDLEPLPDVSGLRERAIRRNDLFFYLLDETRRAVIGLAPTEKGIREAEEWYQRAADQEYGPAFEQLGTLYRSKRRKGADYDKAFEWYRRGAEADDRGSTYLLAWSYEWGQGTAKDERKALELYRELVDGEDFRASLAMYRLALLYDSDRLGERNLEEAIGWYTKAAEKGVRGAQLKLGKLYFYGRGVPQNHVGAVEWFRKAAENEDSSAAGFLGAALLHGLGIERDYAEAVKWFRFSAERNNSRGQLGLGDCYMNGWGVERDPSQAHHWYVLAAEQGNDAAQLRLGVQYMTGDGVAQDFVLAYKWLLLASRHGAPGPSDMAKKALPDLVRSLTAEQRMDAERQADSFVPSWKR